MDIKVVDFDGIRTAADITPAVIDQLHEAFTTIGFVIITNHGVEEKVRDLHQLALLQEVTHTVKTQLSNDYPYCTQFSLVILLGLSGFYALPCHSYKLACNFYA